jgi:hypothetical protein
MKLCRAGSATVTRQKLQPASMSTTDSRRKKSRSRLTASAATGAPRRDVCTEDCCADRSDRRARKRRGGLFLENLLASDFDGDVFPVNLRHDTVLGHRRSPGSRRRTGKVDLAVIATPASTVPGCGCRMRPGRRSREP